MYYNPGLYIRLLKTGFRKFMNNYPLLMISLKKSVQPQLNATFLINSDDLKFKLIE